ncbi:hypothetical protein [Hydrogenophaga sp.]|uniref:hypothetical protein n=1 Tax=Hydrogenophaga sp. TaxID=1904254 RepID=UPI00271F3CB9|nr:hypothetical protein [Hydrogenophaga sp.]MDO9438658.1 hypothetical protein [Hydrogenophaga sp.]
MTTVSGSTSIGPLVQQQTERISSNTSQPSTDAATVSLVLSAIGTAQEQTTLAKAIAVLDAMKGRLQEMEASFSATLKTEFHRPALQETFDKMHDMKQKMAVMEAAIEKLPSLSLQRATLQNRGNEGGLSWKESSDIHNQLSQVNYDIHFAEFQALTGGNFYAFCEHRAPGLRMEAGTLRSRLADGGLSPNDQQKIQDRLEYVEQTLVSVEKNIANGKSSGLLT